MTGAAPLFREQYDQYQAYVQEMLDEAAQRRLVQEAYAAQKQSRLAGYFERITSHWHEKQQG